MNVTVRLSGEKRGLTFRILAASPATGLVIRYETEAAPERLAGPVNASVIVYRRPR